MFAALVDPGLRWLIHGEGTDSIAFHLFKDLTDIGSNFGATLINTLDEWIIQELIIVGPYSLVLDEAVRKQIVIIDKIRITFLTLQGTQ